MLVLFGLIFISLLVGLLFLGLFIWSVKSGQYEDTTSPGWRVLFDDPLDASEEKPEEAAVLKTTSTRSLPSSTYEPPQFGKPRRDCH